MPNQVPNGWTYAVGNDGNSSEADIKSELVYKGKKYSIVTDSSGFLKIYAGGTGFLENSESNNNLISTVTSEGRIDVNPNDGIYGRLSTDIAKSGGSVIGLIRLAQQNQSRALSTYLTPEEKTSLTSQDLKQKIQNVDNSVSTSGISTTYDVSAASPLVNELENFGDKNDFSKLKPFLFYPENIGKRNQDKIIIEQIEYVAAPITENINVTSIASVLGNRESQFAKVASKGSVVLPIPNEISESNQTGWGEDSLTSIAGALMGNASAFASKVAEGNIQASLGTVGDAFKTLNDPAIENRLKRFLVTNAGASILKLGGINVNPESYINRVTGVAINPNLELLFNGPKLRQFAFSFKMTPRNDKEAKNIRSIIKFFKKGMAPRRSTKADKSIYLGTPNVFRMKFMSGSEMKSIGKIKTCALITCGVNYTPDGFYAAYEDGKAGGSQPIAVILSLAFTELTPIFSDEYDVESDDLLDDIGPNGSNFQVETQGN